MNKDAFIEQLAKTDTGKDLIKYLMEVETHYADIRNLDGVDAKVRIDALKLLRSALLDKLLVLSGEIDPPNTDEYN